MYRKQSQEISSFIIRNIPIFPREISKITAEKFGITRQAVHRYLKNLIHDGLVESVGKTSNISYKLKVIRRENYSFPLSPDMQEHIIWLQFIKPLLVHLPENVLDICSHGFTKIFNNVIDHSGGHNTKITVILSGAAVEIWVEDDGIGIFKKIQNSLGLNDQREAISELSKGKLTTDPDHHTGEGIFFTSRMFDHFSIISDQLWFLHEKLDPNDDWLIEAHKNKQKGTNVQMQISTFAEHTVKEIFDKYSSGEEDISNFTKTHIPLTLFTFGDEKLISRSQAKRVLAGFDKFEEICLDFRGVNIIGRAFADEIFRVFRKQHPDINIICLNANQSIIKIINWASQDK